MFAVRELSGIADDLNRLAHALGDLSMGQHLSSQGLERDRLVRTIQHYLIPRAIDPTTPLTVVFAGPTGAGKSTLINSLTGLNVSVAGPLRPTTTNPLVLASADRVHDFDNLAGIRCEVVAGDAPVLDSLVFVDTPDIDSTSTAHRAMAENLIDSADVVVFVTSTLRYSDALPWQVLRRAESRGSDVICVLNRVSSATRGAVVDFRARLVDAGLNDEILTIPEHHLAPGSQSIPSLAVGSLHRRLATLAGTRAETAGRVFDQVLDVTLRQIGDLEENLTAAAREMESLASELTAALTDRVAGLDLTTVAGDLLPPVPEGHSRGDMRRWRRSARRDELTSSEVNRVVLRIENVVDQDVRLWLIEEFERSSITVDPRLVAPQIRPVIRSAMKRWVDYVRRITQDVSKRGVGLAEAILVAAATDRTYSKAGTIVLGDGADEMIGRARRELIGRLQVVYDHIGSQVAELLETSAGVPDLAAIRSAIGRVHSTPADA